MKKYLTLLASVAILLCLGGIYAWSAFIQPLRVAYGFTAVETQLVFGLAIAALTLGMVFAGRLLDRMGPRKTAIIGGILFGTGYLAAAYSKGSYPVILLGIALVAGCGTGFVYICPLSVCIQWFPRHKGLITGVTVAGFGAGAVLLSALAARMIPGGHVLDFFRWIGFTYGFAIVAGSLLLFSPTGSRRERDDSSPYDTTGLVAQKTFWAMAAGMFAGTFAGLLVVGNLAPIGTAFGATSRHVSLSIGLFALGNAAGRVTWGWLYDRTGGRFVLPGALLVLAAAIALLPPAGRYGALFPAAAALTGFGFGSCFVLYAAHVAARYGSHAVGHVYPMVFLFYGLSGILGPAAGGWLFEQYGLYLPAIRLAAGVAFGGAVCVGLLNLWARNEHVTP